MMSSNKLVHNIIAIFNKLQIRLIIFKSQKSLSLYISQPEVTKLYINKTHNKNYNTRITKIL